jgi:DNA repair exonuclease SbcCD nuclease subunit
MKFIHAADLHLDSPLRGLSRYDGAPEREMRGATRVALERLVELALEEAVELILVAGDVYDGDWRDYNTGLFLNRQLGKLAAAGIHVILASGNHDAANRMTKDLKPPKGVHWLDTRKPETVRLGDIGVSVHGQGFATAAETTNLALGYPEPDLDLLNIGLLHTNVGGRAGHEQYAPCSLEDLVAKGYDYWALGHIHQRQVVCESPYIVYAGNLQGRSVRETGAKGVTLVTVEAGKIRNVEARELDVARWEVLRVDCGDCGTSDDVLSRIETAMSALLTAGTLTAIRICLTGTCAAHAELGADLPRWVSEIRNLANTEGDGLLWIEKVLLETSDPPAAQSGGEARFETPGTDPPSDEELAEWFNLNFSQLAGRLGQHPDLPKLDSQALRAVLPQAHALLRGKLYAGGNEE